MDAALPFCYDPLTWIGPSYHRGTIEDTSWVWSGVGDQRYIEVFTGYAFTEWSTDGANGTRDEVAQVGGDGEIAIS